MRLVPALAVAWRLVDQMTWEFELRPNVRFHDGTPFTAADVAFSIARASSNSRASFARYTESVAEIRVIDSHRVRIQTKFPDPALPVEMSPIYVMSERWARRTTPASRAKALARRTMRRGTPTAPVR